MEKTATLNLRVDPVVKKNAEVVLSHLGMSMSTAVNIYLNQISLKQAIPFPITMLTVPDSVNADLMTSDQLHAKLDKGYQDIKDEKVEVAEEAFSKFRVRHTR